MKSNNQYEIALSAAINYCQYQERCSAQVLDKIAKYNVSIEDRNKIISLLSEAKYFDDNRYAELFIISKINKGWGKFKIIYELRHKKINSEIIDNHINNIDDELYIRNLVELIHNKKSKLKSDLNNFEKKQKIAVFLKSKGYEADLIFAGLNKIFDNE